MTIDMNNFNLIAPIYDKLVTLIFGQTLQKAQNVFLSQIPNNAKVLILGGGSGQILVPILKNKPKTKIIYQEASSKMIALSQNRLRKEFPQHYQQVNFIHSSDCSKLPLNQNDVVITPFVLDVFNEDEIKLVFQYLNLTLKKKGKWIWTDFYLPSGSMRPLAIILIQSMYLFFRLVSNISAKKLPDVERYFHQYDYQLLLKRAFIRGIVQSRLYEKK